MHHYFGNTRPDVSYYGSTAIVECNKYTPTFLKTRFDTNIYQINTQSLYTKIEKKTIDECIHFKN